jgi:GAF domain-containing protein
MLDRLRALISPPILRDETQSRAVSLLNALLWMGLLVCSLAGGVSFLAGAHRLRVFAGLSVAAALILFLGLNTLMRRGRVRLAGWLFIGLSLAAGTLLVYSQGGLQTPFTMIFALVIVAAGLLLGAWAAAAAALYSALATFLLLLASWRGLSGLVQTVPPLGAWIVQAVIFALLAGLLALTTRLVNRALAHASQNEQRLVDSLREMMDVRAALEARLADRTQEVARQVNQLQTAAQVGSAIVSLRSLDELLQEVPRLVSQRFGYDHVGVFLLDASGENALLKAASSPAGERMLARGYKLPVGGKSAVGAAAQARQPLAVSDAGQEALFFQAPELPEIHSELALPLVVGDKLLGVLDVQSAARGAFPPVDVAVLKLIADQVAVAIENARLFGENESALEDIRRAYGELNRSAWGKLLSTRPSQGYRCDEEGYIQPVSGEWPEEMVAAEERAATTQPDPQTLAVPVKFGDEVRGVVRLRKPEDGSWSAEEIEFIEDLSEQLFVALESARLYQETQRRAERERLAAQITARLRASNDPQTILQTAVQELRQALQAQRAQAVIQPVESEQASP